MTKLHIVVETRVGIRCFDLQARQGYCLIGLCLELLSKEGYLDKEVSDWVFEFLRENKRDYYIAQKFGRLKIYLFRSLPLGVLVANDMV